eukprot:3545890-Pyramimonas_sp.AAC.1
MPVTWHLKGVSITLISLYLEGTNCFTGNNAANLSAMAAFLHTCKNPWIVAGDFKASPEAFWKSGWPARLGGTIGCLEQGYTCFKKGSEPSLIDYVLMSPEATFYFQ